MAAPRFLQALDHVLELDNGDGYITDCPNCDLHARPGALIHAHPVDGWWRLDCDTCNHDSVTHYLQLTPAQLRAHPDNWDQRLHRAATLAPALTVCQALLRGERVPASSLDPRWLKAYRRKNHQP